MNDRFKFRVWNIKHGIYCDQMTEMVINSNGVCYDNGVSADYFEYNGFIIEQCTGLKDKNGRFIYENDVVLGASGFKYCIIWSEMELGWALQNLETRLCIAMNAFMPDEIEIISNIHEQAEQKDK